MPVPALDKTWQYNVNQTVPNSGSAGTESQVTMLAIVNSLLGFALVPWTVGYSCGYNGSTQVAGTAADGVNRWSNAAALVWATGVHSWIVLKQTGIAANFQICIDLSNSNASTHNCTIVMSPAAGFTGGTTSARPTATDEVVVLSSANWGGSHVAGARRVHAQQSSDGQVSRVFVCRSAAVVTYIEFGKAKNPRAAWTNPCYGVVSGATSGAAAYSVLHVTSTPKVALRHSGVNGVAFMTTEGANNDAIGELQTSADDYDGSFPMTAIGLYSATSGTRGRPGEIYDAWFGSTGVAVGDSYDDLGSKAFVQLDSLITPANGVLWQMA